MIVLNREEVRVFKGESFEPKYIVTQRLNTLLNDMNEAICDFIAYVEFDYDGQIKHCRDAIAIKPGVDIVTPEPKFWNRLRRACQKNNKELVTVPGGAVPYCYSNEIVVANFNVNGSSWYIINRKELGSLLNSEPKMTPEQARLKKLCCGIEPTTVLDKYLLSKDIRLSKIKIKSENEAFVTEGGCSCHHVTRPYWESFITDGEIKYENEIYPTVENHYNSYHNGCIDGYRYADVKNYKYIIEWYMSTYPNGSIYYSISNIFIKEGYEQDTQLLNEIIKKIEDEKILD